ncbi:MAG: hypothetical protein JWQ93_2844 [Marmoricola sp.]|jgi:hypothetical protein|nr:hypothetical protein [Marmoricola sp.]
MLSITYEYTRYLLRTDPSCPVPASEAAEAAAAAPDLVAALSGTFIGTMPVITSIWTQVSPDPVALKAMIQIVLDFTETAAQRGFTRWADVPTAVISDFVHEAHALITNDASRLRKNAMHTCYLALVDADLHHDVSPAEGIHPVVGAVRTDERGKQDSSSPPTTTPRRLRNALPLRSATTFATGSSTATSWSTARPVLLP